MSSCQAAPVGGVNVSPSLLLITNAVGSTARKRLAVNFDDRLASSAVDVHLGCARMSGPRAHKYIRPGGGQCHEFAS
jgi:hypothetical protein